MCPICCRSLTKHGPPLLWPKALWDDVSGVTLPETELQMGGCQNYGPFLGTVNIRCLIIIGIQEGTIIVTTTQVDSLIKDYNLNWPAFRLQIGFREGRLFWIVRMRLQGFICFRYMEGVQSVTLRLPRAYADARVGRSLEGFCRIYKDVKRS